MDLTVFMPFFENGSFAKRVRLYLIVSISLLSVLSPLSFLHSLDNAPPCYKQIQTTFFQQDLVANGLNLYQVPQSMWVGIYNDLQQASSQVPAVVQSLANARNPNPLYPYEPNGAAQVLQQALFHVFQNVMLYWSSVNNNVINQNVINGLFRYLWEQQYPRIAPCLLGGR